MTFIDRLRERRDERKRTVVGDRREEVRTLHTGDELHVGRRLHGHGIKVNSSPVEQQSQRIAVCLWGNSAQWEEQTDWWSGLIPDGYECDLFGHVHGDMPNALDTSRFRAILYEPVFDTLALTREMAARKNICWERGDVTMDSEMTDDAFSLYKSSHLRQKHEIINDLKYDWCIAGVANKNMAPGVLSAPSHNIIYGDHQYDSGLRWYDFDHTFFYGRPRAMDMAGAFFRSLTLIRDSHMNPPWMALWRTVPEHISPGVYFHFHISMLKLDIGEITYV